MKKIVIATDSFKGCLSSKEVGNAIWKGIKTVFPECETLLLPVSDSGEGLLDMLVTALHGQYRKVWVHDPLMELLEGWYGISEDGQTAIIEMAVASGLTLISEAKRNPLHTTTYGTGELIRDALEQGYMHFIIGIGGSATNDAGVGLLQALGFRFYDRRGKLLGKGGKDSFCRFIGSTSCVERGTVHRCLRCTQSLLRLRWGCLHVCTAERGERGNGADVRRWACLFCPSNPCHNR